MASGPQGIRVPVYIAAGGTQGIQRFVQTTGQQIANELGRQITLGISRAGGGFVRGYNRPGQQRQTFYPESFTSRAGSSSAYARGMVFERAAASIEEFSGLLKNYLSGFNPSFRYNPSAPAGYLGYSGPSGSRLGYTPVPSGPAIAIPGPQIPRIGYSGASVKLQEKAFWDLARSTGGAASELGKFTQSLKQAQAITTEFARARGLSYKGQAERFREAAQLGVGSYRTSGERIAASGDFERRVRSSLVGTGQIGNELPNELVQLQRNRLRRRARSVIEQARREDAGRAYRLAHQEANSAKDAEKQRQRLMGASRQRANEIFLGTMTPMMMGLLGPAGFPFLNIGFAAMSGGFRGAGIAAVSTAVGEAARALSRFTERVLQAAEAANAVSKEYKQAKSDAEITVTGPGILAAKAEEARNTRLFESYGLKNLKRSAFFTEMWAARPSLTEMITGEGPGLNLRDAYRRATEGQKDENILQSLIQGRADILRDTYKPSFQSPEALYNKIAMSAAAPRDDATRRLIESLDKLIEQIKKEIELRQQQSPTAGMSDIFRGYTYAP